MAKKTIAVSLRLPPYVLEQADDLIHEMKKTEGGKKWSRNTFFVESTRFYLAAIKNEQQRRVSIDTTTSTPRT